MTDTDSAQQLSKLRDEIQSIDEHILELLATRMKLSKLVGTIKKAHNIPILNEKVFNDKLDSLMKEGEKNGLTRKFVRQIWRRIHQTSVQTQERLKPTS